MKRAVATLKLSATVLAAVPVRPVGGRDLLETLYGGWLDDVLWATYGDLDTVPCPMGAAANTERRLYVQTAHLVRQAMQMAGAQARSGTPYRIASTVIAELHGDLTRECRRCGGTGRRRGRDEKPCRVCRGKGSLPPSLSTRADECQCRLPEFRDHLHGVYLTVLTRLRRELETATAQYVRAEAQMRCSREGLLANSLPALAHG
jgi:hypothetical protein